MGAMPQLGQAVAKATFPNFLQGRDQIPDERLTPHNPTLSSC